MMELHVKRYIILIFCMERKHFFVAFKGIRGIIMVKKGIGYWI